MPEEDVVATSLGASGVRFGVATAVVLLGLAALALRSGFGPLQSWFVYVGVAAVCVLHTVVVHRLDRVRFEATAVVVATRRGETAYAWADVLEVSWTTSTWPYTGSGPVLRLRGGPFDVPGPNAPAQVARLPVFGARASREAQEVVRRAAAAHGVPYTAKLVELIDTGKRMPRLPGEPRDTRRRPS